MYRRAVGRDVEPALGELSVMPSRSRPTRAFVLAAMVVGTTILTVSAPTRAIGQTTTSSEPTTEPPPTTSPTVPSTTTPAVTQPPPTAPPPTAGPSPSAVSAAGRPRRTPTTQGPTLRAATTSPGSPSMVDSPAGGSIEPVPAPATTIADPASSTSAPRSAAVRRQIAAASGTRGRPLASFWWPGALAVAVGGLSIVGGRRMRTAPVHAEVDEATTHDVLVDLESAEREAHAPAERMAVALERLRATAPPVGGRRRHRSRGRSPRA